MADFMNSFSFSHQIYSNVHTAPPPHGLVPCRFSAVEAADKSTCSLCSGFFPHFGEWDQGMYARYLRSKKSP